MLMVAGLNKAVSGEFQFFVIYPNMNVSNSIRFRYDL
jgi:hypothetical protein